MKKTSTKQASKIGNSDNQADLQRRINEAQQLVDELRKEIDRRKSELPQVPRRIPLWVYVRDYLRDNGGEDTLQNILGGLLSAGHDLGKFPYRNVKTMVVSRYMEGVFSFTKQPNGTEIVRLVEGTPRYTAMRNRNQG